jgi:hypothetical protein
MFVFETFDYGDALMCHIVRLGRAIHRGRLWGGAGNANHRIGLDSDIQTGIFSPAKGSCAVRAIGSPPVFASTTACSVLALT